MFAYQHMSISDFSIGPELRCAPFSAGCSCDCSHVPGECSAIDGHLTYDCCTAEIYAPGPAGAYIARAQAEWPSEHMLHALLRHACWKGRRSDLVGNCMSKMGVIICTKESAGDLSNVMCLQGTSNASTVQPVVDMERTIFCEFPSKISQALQDLTHRAYWVGTPRSHASCLLGWHSKISQAFPRSTGAASIPMLDLCVYFRGCPLQPPRCIMNAKSYSQSPHCKGWPPLCR
jgi:hypothetical protein